MSSEHIKRDYVHTEKSGISFNIDLFAKLISELHGVQSVIIYNRKDRKECFVCFSVNDYRQYAEICDNGDITTGGFQSIEDSQILIALLISIYPKTDSERKRFPKRCEIGQVETVLAQIFGKVHR